MSRVLPRFTLFPTRRSSDLYRMYCDARKLAVGPGLTLLEFKAQERRLRRAYADVLASAEAASQVDLVESRSEEHTSELQSLRHLVCRLLLEKKKNHISRKSS